MAHGLATPLKPKTLGKSQKERLLRFGSLRLDLLLARVVYCRHNFLILHFRFAGCAIILLLVLMLSAFLCPWLCAVAG